ncbi:MAG: phage tail protein [Methylocystis sp.]|uniref:phage tail protein n=1 Tax=Methylocystis sp. TaxID=1911079 RepID=UPI003DA1D923
MSEANIILTTFRFDVQLQFGTAAAGSSRPPRTDTGDVRLGFQEVSGLELEMDAPELVEGGRNDGVIRRAGRVKSPTLVLKRGMFVEERTSTACLDFWIWIQGVMNGELPVRRCDGSVSLKANGKDGRTPTPMCVWVFERGLPLKVKGPDLNAKTGEIAIEELHIAHQGLRMNIGGPAT